MTALIALAVIYLAVLVAATRTGHLGRWTRALRDDLAPVWAFLGAGLRELRAGPVQANPASVPQQLARTPRDPRQGLDPDDPANVLLLEVCPVCGMDDPDRFELGVATGTWDGWPAHDTCVAWLGGPAAEPPPASVRDTAATPGPTSWKVTPSRGISVCVTGQRAGDSRHALMLLYAADPVLARTDLICREYPAGPLIVLTGEPGLPAMALAVPPGAEVIAWIGIPAACTQITPAMIRCALPSELPGLR